MITYNHEPYIAQAVECVINQKTNFPFELVIGEDCSTDKTQAIVLDYQQKYSGIIKVITSEKNVGMLSNSLRTTMACTGKYIAYCEGDDYWHNPNKLQMQVDFLEANPDYGMIHSNMHCYFANEKKLRRANLNEMPLYDDCNAYIEILTQKRRIATLTVCARNDLIKSVIEKNPECTDSTYLMGDYQLWLEVSRIAKVKYIHEALATYSVLPESMSRSQDANKTLKFEISAKELSCHYLAKYICPVNNARNVRGVHANNVLKAAIIAKNVEVAKRQMVELRELKIKSKLNLTEYLVYLGLFNNVAKFVVEILKKIRYLLK